MKRNLLYIALIVFAGFLGYFLTSRLNDGVWLFLGDKSTAEDVVETVKKRLTYDFQKDRWYKLVLLALKEEKKLEVWGIPLNQGPARRLKVYSIEGYIGMLGPKLNPLDHKIPEGIYEVVELEPNHNFHRGLILNYPNEFDQLHGASVEAEFLENYRFTIHGSNIKTVSVELEGTDADPLGAPKDKGFFDQLFNFSELEDHSNVKHSKEQGFHGNIQVGDDAIIDELFTMVYEIGNENVTVIVAPYDMRSQQDRILDIPGIAWEDELYQMIQDEITFQLGTTGQ